MKSRLLLWLIIILGVITIVGWGIFYAYQKFSNPMPTPTITPLATLINQTTARLRAFKDCVPIAQGAPENLTPLINEEEQDKMLGLLSPFGEVKGFYDDDFTHKACLFGFKGNEIIGELYFITASTSGGMEVATIKWQSAP